MLTPSLATIHGLFLDVFQALVRRELVPATAALTPREALRAHRLDAESEALFRDLLFRAERAVFGEAPISEAELEHCRRVHQALTQRVATASATGPLGDGVQR